ncbi:NAD(P)H-dependent oxidoreductase [Psittacicella hinzii]|uniref:Flavodoxin-like fold domain-containing protein n=1 Tax=Psittacicella hinzii TaxID=2028575 RepID=A0A3A1YT98_9GAMM|nr:NAD(P)H-dependent oxidoreductase [Psittacicella hinzii]RIY40140.1 hypothetical protein CKF58_00990 [Psittacicella hinzii]
MDVAAEKAAHEAADRIVYLFPVHWFNLTPLLKEYMNSVWEFNWAFGPEGYALQDKEFLVVTAAGGMETTYQLDGLIRRTGADILSSLEASAYYVGMTYLEPVIFYQTISATPEIIAQHQQVFAQRLAAPLNTHVRNRSVRTRG